MYSDSFAFEAQLTSFDFRFVVVLFVTVCFFGVGVSWDAGRKVFVGVLKFGPPFSFLLRLRTEAVSENT